MDSCDVQEAVSAVEDGTVQHPQSSKYDESRSALSLLDSTRGMANLLSDMEQAMCWFEASILAILTRNPWHNSIQAFLLMPQLI
jgi:hypothetical protein